MNHTEAVKQMVVEQYLLDELTPDAREAFEEHLFDCPDCALDLRAGAAFVDEAKAELPGIAVNTEAPAKVGKFNSKPDFRLSWWKPAFVAPVFAAMLLVLVFQNVVTFPALREAANQPRIVPVAPLHGATRGGNHLTLIANRTHGVALPIDLYIESGMAPAASYSFDLRDPQGKLAWTGTMPAAVQESDSGQRLSIVIPGSMLRNGSYSLSVTSVASNGERTTIQQYIFDIVVSN